MIAYLIPIVAGCAVFFLFMLAFMRRDDQVKRGGRLAGCALHDAGQGCDRCRDRQPATRRPHLPDQWNDSDGNARQGDEERHKRR